MKWKNVSGHAEDPIRVWLDPSPLVTSVTAADQSTGSELFTNSATVDVTIAAEGRGGKAVVAYLVTETAAQPSADDPGWAADVAPGRQRTWE